jgi:hypothetical protein
MAKLSLYVAMLLGNQWDLARVLLTRHVWPKEFPKGIFTNLCQVMLGKRVSLRRYSFMHLWEASFFLESRMLQCEILKRFILGEISPPNNPISRWRKQPDRAHIEYLSKFFGTEIAPHNAAQFLVRISNTFDLYMPEYSRKIIRYIADQCCVYPNAALELIAPRRVGFPLVARRLTNRIKANRKRQGQYYQNYLQDRMCDLCDHSFQMWRPLTGNGMVYFLPCCFTAVHYSCAIGHLDGNLFRCQTCRSFLFKREAEPFQIFDHFGSLGARPVIRKKRLAIRQNNPAPPSEFLKYVNTSIDIPVLQDIYYSLDHPQ